MEFVSILILGAAICSFIGYAVSDESNRATGAILGAVLGPIGIVIALLSAQTKK